MWEKSRITSLGMRYSSSSQLGRVVCPRNGPWAAQVWDEAEPSSGREGYGEGMEVGMGRAALAGPSLVPPHLPPLLLLPQLQREQWELRGEQRFPSEMKSEHTCEQGAAWRKGQDVVGIPGHVFLKRVNLS